MAPMRWRSSASPRCSNEEAYLLQKLGRAVLRTPNVDHGAGVYADNSTETLLRLLGHPAATGALQDLSASQLILVDGLDLARQLPTVAGRVVRARLRGARLIVVGERSHRVAEHAQPFLQLRPGTEDRLYAAMAKVIVDRGLQDRSFLAGRCQGAEAFLSAVREVDLIAAAAACGLEAAGIQEAAVAFGQARAAAILYSTATPRRPEVVEALVNLALLTGNVGRVGGGVYPLAEHNNLQGVCDVGMLPGFFPGSAPPAPQGPGPSSPAAGGLPSRNRPAWGRSGLLRASADPPGGLALPLRSGGHRHRACSSPGRRGVRARGGPARLPGGGSPLRARGLPTPAFGEEQVTFTSTERRVQLVARAVAPPSGVEPAWAQLAERLAGWERKWAYASGDEVMEEIASVVPFYSGISYPALARDHGRQWPCTQDRPLGTRTSLPSLRTPSLPSSSPRRRPGHPHRWSIPPSPSPWCSATPTTTGIRTSSCNTARPSGASTASSCSTSRMDSWS